MQPARLRLGSLRFPHRLLISRPEFCSVCPVLDSEIQQLLKAQAEDGTELNGEPPAVVLFTLRQVVEDLEDLEDLRITEGVTDALLLHCLWERRRGAVNGL